VFNVVVNVVVKIKIIKYVLDIKLSDFLSNQILPDVFDFSPAEGRF
jgi:hypothetical protein